MRNKIFASIWTTVGMYLGLHAAMIPLGWFVWVLERFCNVDENHKTPAVISIVIVMESLVFLLLAAIYSGRWFYRLFYHGELWGYKPENNLGGQIKNC